MPNVLELLPVMDFLLTDARNHCLHQPGDRSFVADRLAQVLDCRVGKSDCEFDIYIPGSRKMPDGRILIEGRRSEFNGIYSVYYCSDLSYYNEAGEFVWDIWKFYYSFDYMMQHWNGSFSENTEAKIRDRLALPEEEFLEKVSQDMVDLGYEYLEEEFEEGWEGAYAAYLRDVVEGSLYLFFKINALSGKVEDFVFSNQDVILPCKKYYDDIYAYIRTAINCSIFPDGGDPLLMEKCAAALMPYYFRTVLSTANSADLGWLHLYLGHSQEVDAVLNLAKTGSEIGYPYFHQLVELAKKCMLLPDNIDLSGEGVLYRRSFADGEMCVIHFGGVYVTAVTDDSDFYDEIEEGGESASFLSLTCKVFSMLYEDFQNYLSYREGVSESDLKSCAPAG